MLACALVLAACGRAEQGYPPGYERNFLTACNAQNPGQGVCGCIWEKIKAEVPRWDFEALERVPVAMRESQPLTRQIENYAFACGGGSDAL